MRLYLNTTSSAAVMLASTSMRQWSAALAFARVLTGHEWPPTFDDPLTGLEQAVITAGRVPGPVALASALLRRLRVLGDTTWLRIRGIGADTIHVSWAGGRRSAQVAAALVHPLAGLPGDRFYVVPAASAIITITISGAAGGSTAKVVLRRVPPAAPPSGARVDAAAAWAEFDRVMTLPNSVLPAPVPSRVEAAIR